MSRSHSAHEAEVMVAAVISRTQLPGASIADLEPGDILQTEPEVGADPIVRLTVGTTTVAFASIAKIDGRLIATIVENRPELSGRKGDKWKDRKANPQTA
jgi:hypothetical protein